MWYCGTRFRNRKGEVDDISRDRFSICSRFGKLLIAPAILRRETILGVNDFRKKCAQKSQGDIYPSFFLHKEFFVTLKGHTVGPSGKNEIHQWHKGILWSIMIGLAV